MKRNVLNDSLHPKKKIWLLKSAYCRSKGINRLIFPDINYSKYTKCKEKRIQSCVDWGLLQQIALGHYEFLSNSKS